MDAEFTAAEPDVLRQVPTMSRVMPSCFNPNVLCGRFIAAGLVEIGYAGNLRTIALTAAGRERLRMVN